ncbi:MAG: carboxypeptidase-like regulatory domain-containing protein [Candidatus Azobacteroides sp.]|nr:carboxypeptidase-like regulatory domain-containing protein [Candidatus Azobacteroides sp.]
MRSCFIGIICFFGCCSFAKAEEILDQEIQLPKTRETTYELLNRITDLTGFFFIYDSDVIRNEKKIKFSGGKHTLRQSIYLITQNQNIQIKVMGRHILLYKKEALPSSVSKSVPIINDSLTYVVAKAMVKDAQTQEPIPHVSASIAETGIGTITNQSGEFMLKIPLSDSTQYIQISHVGYNQQIIPVELFRNNPVDIYMQTKIIPLEEVIIGLVNPQKIIREMLNNKPINYQKDPVYFTAFYREGIEKKNTLISLTEAVFQIYKTGFESSANDQVKLLKMRKISNEDEHDSLIVKMRAGIDASLRLDIIKYIPDFLDLSNEPPFIYTKIDMTVTDSSLAHVIAFEQKPGIAEPFYKGELYIDAENSALLAAHFEVDPRYIDKATDIFVLKKPKGVDIKPENASYYVYYKYWNGKYYLNHIRGDVTFKMKKKNILFQPSKSIHIFFEMVVCKIDTCDVKRFPRKESISTRTVFSETKFHYDNRFWDDFNVILPEKELNEAITRISSKIEEME